jgi:hypothetical protein
VALVVFFDEQLEIGEFLGREDEGFGVDAGFHGVFSLEWNCRK